MRCGGGPNRHRRDQVALNLSTRRGCSPKAPRSCGRHQRVSSRVNRRRPSLGAQPCAIWPR